MNIEDLRRLAQRRLPKSVFDYRDGAIVDISSIASIRYTGYPSVAYNASKGAVNQLTQNIAIQYRLQGNSRQRCASRFDEHSHNPGAPKERLRARQG